MDLECNLPFIQRASYYDVRFKGVGVIFSRRLGGYWKDIKTLQWSLLYCFQADQKDEGARSPPVTFAALKCLSEKPIAFLLGSELFHT